MLKECSSGLARPLSHIFNLSLSLGVFPSQWKIAVIQPIYKRKGSRNDLKLYRPIALLPCVSKVLESIVCEQLLAHCFSTDCIPDEQFGFLPKRSTVWQLLTILEEWEQTLDEGGHVHACFLDVAKAFDRVDHGLLLQKLSSIGLTGITLTWFQSYLSERSICTTVDSVRSSLRRITSGVPQGSVLGPLLFVIFFRDLPAAVRSSCALFADDTLLYSCCTGGGQQCCSQLQGNLDCASQWADDWATTFNPEKSVHMVVSRRQRAAVNLTLGSIAIPPAQETRHLGVRISSNLTWSTHIQDVIKRTSYKVFILKRLAFRCGANAFIKKLYIALLRPVLEYAGPAWDSCSKRDTAALERI